MLRTKITILFAVLLFCGMQAAADYPPSGYDYVSTSAMVQIYPDSSVVTPSEYVFMEGYAVIWRSDPYDAGGGMMAINTRMDTLLLRGWSVGQGDSIFVTLNRDTTSDGMISQVTPGIDFPAESFFDVFYKITYGTEPNPAKVGDAGFGFQGRFDYDAAGGLELKTPLILLESTSGLGRPNLVVDPGATDRDRQLGHVYAQLSGAGDGGGGIYADQPFNIDIYMENFSGDRILSVNHGFQIYSPDGAMWTAPNAAGDPAFCAMFELGCFLTELSVDGSGADTIGFGAAAMFTGMADGWSGLALTIGTQVDVAEVGKTLCFDSAFFPPAGVWMWNGQAMGGIFPDWAGPYCWDIIEENPFECEPQYIDHSGGNISFYQPIPDNNAITQYGETFEASPSGCCRLDTASIAVYPPAFAGSPDLIVNVFADDGSGMPGGLLATETVPYASLPAGLDWVNVDFMPYNLMFCNGDKIHIGVEWSGPDTIAILLDDGSTTPSDTTSWCLYQGVYYSMEELFDGPSNYDFLIAARICCEVGVQNPVGNVDAVHMWDEIWQIPPHGRVYQDPRRTPVIDLVTGDTLFWVWHEHRVDPPSGGTDTIPTIGLMPIWVGPNPPGGSQQPDETIRLVGDAIVARSDPYINEFEQPEIQTEILSMDLTGESSLFGTTILSLPGPAPGLVTSLGSDGEFFPAESFFDVYYEVEFPQIGQTIAPSGEPPHMQTTVEALPPVDNQYTTDDQIHPVHDVQNPGVIIGWVRPIHWVNPRPAPPPDTVPTIGIMPVIIGPNPPSAGQLPDETIQLTGDAIIQRGSEYTNAQGHPEIQTELVAMDLTGPSTSFGQVNLSLSQQSTGLVTGLGPESLLPGESFFDVFYEVELPDQGQTIQPVDQAPVRMETTVDVLPPNNNQYEPTDWHPVEDVQSPGIIIGWVRPIHWVRPPDPPPPDPIPTIGIMPVILGPNPPSAGQEPDETIQLVGNAVVQRGSQYTNGDGNYETHAELEAMDLTGNSNLFGPVTLSLPQPALGLITSQNPGSDFPAESFFDVYYQIDLPEEGLVVVPENPVRMQTTIHDLPPADNQYEAVGWHPVIDVNAPGIIIGWVWPIHWVQPPPPPPPDTIPTIGIMRVIEGPAIPQPGQPADDSIVLAGNAIVQVGSAYTNPFEKQEVHTEMLSMDLTGNSLLFGEVILSLPEPALGLVTSQFSGSDFPAESFFDVFYQVDLPNQGQTIRPQAESPRMSTVVDTLPPVDNYYQAEGWHPVADIQNPSDIIGWVWPIHWVNPRLDTCVTGWTPGIDVIPLHDFMIDLYDPTGLLITTLAATGNNMTVQRDMPSVNQATGIATMPTTILQLSGSGDDPVLLGPFEIRLDPGFVSGGFIRMCDSCNDNWAESFFDVYYVIVTQQPWPMDTLHSAPAQMHLSCAGGWDPFPGGVFTPPWDIPYDDPRHVEIYDNDGNLIGTVVKQHTPRGSTCCKGVYRGNIDYSDPDNAGDLGIDISDLVYLVDYMFTGGPPPVCWAEANVDCSCCGPDGVPDTQDDVDISDLVYLVDYMFTLGQRPCRCDCTDCVRKGASSKAGEDTRRRWSSHVSPRVTPQSGGR